MKVTDHIKFEVDDVILGHAFSSPSFPASVYDCCRAQTYVRVCTGHTLSEKGAVTSAYSLSTNLYSLEIDYSHCVILKGWFCQTLGWLSVVFIMHQIKCIMAVYLSASVENWCSTWLKRFRMNCVASTMMILNVVFEVSLASAASHLLSTSCVIRSGAVTR